MKRTALSVFLVFAFLAPSSQVSAVTTAPQIAQDKLDGYDRSLFKHWIDANKNGCDTRAEVLIVEAVVKPKIDKKCKLTGGKWVSAYDGKTLTDASKLDVDHLVPLAEAWRSGAWAWTAKQRQDYANDLSDSRALIAVTLTSNRSKSDKDISEWVPKLDTCTYIKNWVAIKIRYSLTYDDNEAAALASYSTTCPIGELKVEILPDYQYQSAPESPSPTPLVPASPTPEPSTDSKIRQYINTNEFLGLTYKDFSKNYSRLIRGSFIEVQVIDPPAEYFTEDLNDTCVVESTSPEGTGQLRTVTLYEGETLKVLARCRWVLAEGISGAAWKWTKGTSKSPLVATDCPKLIEIDIEGFKALQCVPSLPIPTASPKPSSSATTSTNGPKLCWVNGYTTKKGTLVKGYYRNC
jgi:hypothetical protein